MNKGIDTLINAISSNIDKLKSGNLSTSELEELTAKSRELYEMLTVMRYLKENKTEVVSEPTIEEENPVEEIVEPTPSNSGLMFDIDEPAQEEVPLFEPIAEPEIEAPKPTIEPEPVAEPEVIQEEIKVEDTVDDESINNNYQGSFSGSIANKMRMQPIRNLAGHISLNQRFIFIANLFDNNADEYNQTIATVDKMTDGNTAKNHLNALQNKFNWDLENKHVEEFVTLVERRFIS